MTLESPQAPPSGDDQKQCLSDVGEEILAALSVVVQAAQQALSGGSSGISAAALLRPSNLMVGEAHAERFIVAQNAEQRASLRRVLSDPFVARVEVDWGTGGKQSVQTIYFARRSAAGLTNAG
jgi:hypothetical protein